MRRLLALLLALVTLAAPALAEEADKSFLVRLGGVDRLSASMPADLPVFTQAMSPDNPLFARCGLDGETVLGALRDRDVCLYAPRDGGRGFWLAAFEAADMETNALSGAELESLCASLAASWEDGGLTVDRHEVIRAGGLTWLACWLSADADSRFLLCSAFHRGLAVTYGCAGPAGRDEETLLALLDTLTFIEDGCDDQGRDL